VALTRNNHFVPQLYLKNFATDSGKVLEYRTLVCHPKVPTWNSVNVAGTGYEKNLYTRIVRGEEADDIEQWLNSEFESPAREPLQKVLTDKKLTRDDWEILVRFLASQIVRTPAFLIKNLPIWNKMAPIVLEQATKDLEARIREALGSGQKIVEDDVPYAEYFPLKTDRKDIPEEKKVLFTTTLTVDRRLWFYTMKHTLTDTLKFLHRHKWTIFEAPARLHWFTSDDPVICLNYRSESDYDFNGGWGRERANILFPLSPRHLMFTEIGTNSYPRKVPSHYRARLIRRMIAEHAHRSIYSQSEDNKVPQLRPRVEDTLTYENERKSWAAWYENQSRAEQAL
jgi:hypothetical protein